jgi:hypothetical protein
MAQTIHFCPGDPTSPEGYDGTGLPGQNTHAFQAKNQMASRFSGIAGFASAGRGGKSLCSSAAVERTK